MNITLNNVRASHAGLTAESIALLRQKKKIEAARRRHRDFLNDLSINGAEPTEEQIRFLSEVEVLAASNQSRKDKLAHYSRACNIIKGFLRGLAYERVENKRYTDVPKYALDYVLGDVADYTDRMRFMVWYVTRPAIAGIPAGNIGHNSQNQE